ncbi:aspartate--tRNA ligase [Thermoflavifilum thermophilum]|uniref:Aspartate--tRNA ligase n=1 Tax=Thermoflavifilum thermophilum TaxID=1393122 RepID=A0A1I7N7A9_9BACT|nr:aspartate--tRNA ligase [Thermoflavifilum thermophilum]SFV30537.1 aspartyl-tRNA synthetase [Thermoflavifilum thermophilum]
MYRTHTCGELRLSDAGKKVKLAGWVQRIRKFGKMTFVDLRDRYGITQLVFTEAMNQRLEDQPLNREYVIQAEGRVVERSNKNPHLPTGDVELVVEQFDILNEAKTPPFTIEEDTDGGDDLRMKYRYLDLRRPPLQRNLLLRYRASRAVREYLDQHGFVEVETPFLIKSTPEGARDFVVPSRMNPHQFYALPQSPQTFKQLLMVSGFDRYYQIVRCFRDEDLRADRQPEFTQVDCEMSFVEQEDVLQVFEGMMRYVFKQVAGVELPDPFPRMSWDEAMWKYGNDKPDLRFDMCLHNLKVRNQIHCPAVDKSGFGVLDQAETILALVVPNGASYTRKQLDELTEWVKRPQIGMQGLLYVRCQPEGELKSSADKYLSQEILRQIQQFCHAQPGDLILMLAGKEDRTRKAAAELRLELGERLGLRQKDVFKPLWILDFPLFEYSEEESLPGSVGRWVARHHPFTAPRPEHIPVMIENSPLIPPGTDYQDHPYAGIKANAYDMVINGQEVGGGSIRIFRRDLQEKMFAALGLSPEEARQKFGFLLGAFEYGAPPHGGIAFGFDRLCAILGGSDTIRDFIAFPKNNAGRDMMLDAPSPLEESQLRELHICLRKDQN